MKTVRCLGIIAITAAGLLSVGGCSPQTTEPTSVIDVSAREGYAPLTVEFDGAYSFGNIVWYSWSFGDGSEVASFTSEEPLDVEIEHTYDSAGIYVATLTVQDNEGRSDMAKAAIVVSRIPPTALFSSLPDTGEVPLTVSLDASESSAFGVDITEYRWNFGNGSVGEGAEASCTYRYPGTYHVSLTVIDDHGDIGTASRILYVTPPIMIDGLP